MYMCVCALLWLLWLPQESGQEETDAGGREEERVKVESKLDKRVQVRPHPHYSCHVTTPTHRTLSH